MVFFHHFFIYKQKVYSIIVYTMKKKYMLTELVSKKKINCNLVIIYLSQVVLLIIISNIILLNLSIAFTYYLILLSFFDLLNSIHLLLKICFFLLYY